MINVHESWEIGYQVDNIFNEILEWKSLQINAFE